MKLQRQLNIELLRIFSMLLINLWHIPIHFGNTLSQGTSTTNVLMTYVTYFISFHVNLFILITGYFGVEGGKKCISALVKTLLLVYFYSITLGIVSQIVLGYFNYRDVFMPISSKTWWFMTMYTVMLLIAPIIEKYVQDCSRKTIYAIAGGALFVDLYLGHFRHVEGIYDEGLGMTHFVCMYLLGVWIRKEGLNLVRLLPWTRTCLVLFILCIMVIQYKAIAWVSWTEIASYSGPYSIAMSMLVFLLFANINIPESLRKPILFFSSSAISVYLITEYPTILEILKTLFASAYPSCSDSAMEVVLVSHCIIIAFVVPCLIDKVRIPVTNYAKDRITQIIDR
jgi:surface polysaccharide O-acyltransferase-like enzyme